MNPLVAKLRTFVDLPPEDEAFLETVCRTRRAVAAGETIIRQTDDPDRVTLGFNGFLARYKTLPDGRTQIVGYMVPGDFSDLHAFTPKSLDDDVKAIDDGVVVDLDRRRLASLFERPAVAEGLFFSSQIDEATAREWILNVGRRSPHERVAHLLCELFLRLRIAGRAEEDACPLPMTPADLAETTGLSVVQVVRALSEFETDRIIRLEAGRLTIFDPVRLRSTAGFSARYLQIDDDWGRRHPGPSDNPDASLGR
ncbi:Crp/Fnr family transcriptional regulator [Aureimonas sp. Leaf454]|uniref:Crp/Fnr family transcriptional regulator n=1 Tax=Aureimonas sp. Leaf454 TaxID=1736381 RepID=UPI000B1D2D31|nr:Crp/Fnr family transcriptional regulator [Aureimonas sp. Leaf454]